MTQHHTEKARILAFVGLTGSGKSEAVNYVCKKGFPKVYFGGVVLNAMKEAGIEWTEANERQFREEIRKREGKSIIDRKSVV